jgi:hypothetical protein
VEGDPEFVHEIHLGRVPWALWVICGWLAVMSVALWVGISWALDSAENDPVVRVILVAGAVFFQVFLAAILGVVLIDGRLRAGTYRVVLTDTELRVTYPPALFGRSYMRQSFTVPVARVERLVIDRATGEEPCYSVHCDDGTQRQLDLPRGDENEVWPRLFAAVERLRPEVKREDWTHTLRGRVPTNP